MAWLKAKIRALLSGSSPGITMAEVLVTAGIMGITMSLMGGALFQALGTQRFLTDDAIATKDLRNAGSWLSRDAFNAETTDLTGCVPAASCVTLTWTDTDSVSHSASYSIVASAVRAKGRPSLRTQRKAGTMPISPSEMGLMDEGARGT